MKKTTLALIASLPLMAAPIVEAVSVSTSPVGFINVTIKGTDNGGFTAISAPMLPQVEYSGVISGATASTITDDSGNWAGIDFSERDPNGSIPYYAEITSHTDSTKVGFILRISSSSGTVLNVGEDATGLDGASYSIRKFATLGGVFGSTNTAGLKSGTGTSTSDLIYKMGGGAWVTYYYQEAPPFAGGNGWRKAGNPDDPMDGVVIYPHEGLFVRRREATDLSLTIPGSIKANNSHATLTQGFNLVAYSFPVNRKLGQLTGLQSELTAGTGASTSDVIYMLNTSGSFDRFYYQDAPPFAGGTGWRKAGDDSTPQDDVDVLAGTAVIIYRRSADDINWSSTKPF